jgi:hypothetical protein
MPDVSDEINAPIEVYADDSVIDGGIAAVPKMLLRFARHLNCDGSRLNDRQVLLLVMVIALREDRNLRLSNLPMTAAVSTLENDLTFFRKSGLVFTRRDYYPAVEGKPPRMRSQIWDIRSLNANLSHLQRLWFNRQSQKLSEWRSAGERGPSPVYEFPKDFRHKVVLPRPVLEHIAAGRFFPVPDKWLKLATESCSPDEIAGFRARLDPQLPTASNTGGRDAANMPTASITGGRGLPTASKTGGHLLTSSSPPEHQPSFVDEGIFAHFAQRKGQPYAPTGRDRKALKTLQDTGYSLEQIRAVIDETFDRGDHPKRFTYCARIVQDRPPACPPAAPTEPTRPPEAMVGLPPELESLVELIAETERDQPVVRRRLKVMADSCDGAARQHGASGAKWVKDALERSLGKDDPLTYAAAILRSWSVHGPEADLRLRREPQIPESRRSHSKARRNSSNWNDSIDA